MQVQGNLLSGGETLRSMTVAFDSRGHSVTAGPLVHFQLTSAKTIQEKLKYYHLLQHNNSIFSMFLNVLLTNYSVSIVAMKTAFQ